MKLWGLVDGEIKDLKAEIARLRLTEKERKAVEDSIKEDEAATHYERADILRGMLERLGGER